MTSTLSTIHYYMWAVWKNSADERTSEYYLSKYQFYLPMLIISTYFWFVTYYGPRYMAKRKPYELTKTIITYNTLMVLINAYFFWQTLKNFRFGYDIFDFEYKHNAQTNMDPLELIKVQVSHQYLVSKFIDLLDTIFFVLRKKQTQVTKLHLYHHISVPTFGWVIFRMIPTNGPVAIFALFNTLIHVIMYSYYSLAALGPSVKPYLWWKKYVTQIQIYQFVIYSMFSWLFAFKQVGYPAYLQILAYTQPLIFLVLFSRFYISSYLKKSNNKTTILKSEWKPQQKQKSYFFVIFRIWMLNYFLFLFSFSFNGDLSSLSLKGFFSRILLFFFFVFVFFFEINLNKIN